jgi:hypothetical protein
MQNDLQRIGWNREIRLFSLFLTFAAQLNRIICHFRYPVSTRKTSIVILSFIATKAQVFMGQDTSSFELERIVRWCHSGRQDPA